MPGAASSSWPMPAVTDALRRRVVLPAPARRVVSLVPSETETVAALAGLERLVGRTEWCEEPAGRIEGVPTVGGTKKIDRAAVLALEPDLVLANQEENTRADVEALEAAGLTVHVSFPQTIDDTAAWLRSLGTLLGREGEAQRVAARLGRDDPAPGGPRVWAPVWRDPWMTFDDRTYGAAVLRRAGGVNAFGTRARLYPLAADLGEAEAKDPGERDTRYPRLSRAQIEAAAPDVVLLADEPFRFRETHVEELLGWDLPAAKSRRIHLVSGKDLFWYGVRTAAAVARIGALLSFPR
jgi:ABC-type Fe3+-hydroxamate transport system substrate-binding protein